MYRSRSTLFLNRRSEPAEIKLSKPRILEVCHQSPQNRLFQGFICFFSHSFCFVEFSELCVYITCGSGVSEPGHVSEPACFRGTVLLFNYREYRVRFDPHFFDRHMYWIVFAHLYCNISVWIVLYTISALWHHIKEHPKELHITFSEIDYSKHPWFGI